MPTPVTARFPAPIRSPESPAAPTLPSEGTFRVHDETRSQRTLPSPLPAGPLSSPSHPEPAAHRILSRILTDERAMDAGLGRALAGGSFTPAQLLALQVEVIRYSQELEVASRLVEKTTSAVRQVMTTQV